MWSCCALRTAGERPQRPTAAPRPLPPVSSDRWLWKEARLCRPGVHPVSALACWLAAPTATFLTAPSPLTPPPFSPAPSPAPRRPQSYSRTHFNFVAHSVSQQTAKPPRPPPHTHAHTLPQLLPVPPPPGSLELGPGLGPRGQHRPGHVAPTAACADAGAGLRRHRAAAAAAAATVAAAAAAAAAAAVG